MTQDKVKDVIGVEYKRLRERMLLDVRAKERECG